MAHYSVLLQESIEGLQVKSGKNYIDGTLGAGGHSYRILELTAPDGRLLGFDADPLAHQIAGERLAPFGDRVRLVEANYSRMVEIAKREGFFPVAGVLLDLGVSSMQLDDPQRGFSFMGEGALDMRFGEVQGSLTAAKIVNAWTEAELVKLFFELGEEPQARKFAKVIVEARKQRPFETTKQLAEVLERFRPAGRDKKPIHPATKVFQALRMAVNQELERLEEGLNGAVEVLEKGGRLAVISFHSLEDRVVKRFMQFAASDKIILPDTPAVLAQPKEPTLKIITKKPVEAGVQELGENRRSRSAKLRIAEKL
jgi:16S rRNA (cytosine1402-N4)-methyltransferase